MYDTCVMERTMAAPMRKTAAPSAPSNGGGRFPPEAYRYDDDVTPEAVNLLRQKAAKAMGDSDDWEVVDGFGLARPS